MKKLLLLCVIAFVTSLLLLQGCGKDDDTPQETRSETKVNTPADPEENGFHYRETEGGVTLTSYSGTEKHVVIPDEIGGKTVVSISEKAFERAEFETVTVSENVKDIGQYAFRYCAKLTSVTLPKELKIIRVATFNFCPSLVKVVFPEKLEAIEENAFGETDLTEVVLPDTTKSIGKFSFYSCDNLKSFKSGKGLETIGMSCFASCTSLTDVVLNEGLKTIEEKVFAGCVSLKEIELPATVEVLKRYVFQATGIETMTFSSGLKKIENYAFYDCKSLKHAYIPQTVEAIEEYAFEGCKGLTLHGVRDSEAEIHADYYGYKFEKYEF